MYKDFYKKEIEKISEILAKDNIHIVKVWSNFQKYIYGVSDERNICTDLILVLDKSPKSMKVITSEEITRYMQFNPNRPEFFSLQSRDYGTINDTINFNFYKYDPRRVAVSIKIEYAKENDYENFNIEVDKGKPTHSEHIMTYVNNKIEDLENEFNVDLSSEKFDLKDNNKIRMESWTKNYESPIFGEYTLKFKIYETNHEYTIEIENSFTNNIYKVEDKFSSYHDAVDWMGHIKDNLIPLNDEDLAENI